MSHWIIVPTYNERENIGPLVREIFQVLPGAKVLVVDDQSPDGTAREVETAQRVYPNLHLHVRAKKMGLGSAYIEAFRKLLATEKFETVTTMDADFSHSPRYLPQMHAMAAQYDVVIGSRYVDGGGTSGWSRRRQLLSLAGNNYARAIAGVPVKDLTSGFVTFRRTALEKLPLARIHSTGYAYTIESKCLAILTGASVKEMPILFTERRRGASKLSWSILVEAASSPWRVRSSRAKNKCSTVLATDQK